jgi:hypothetical protein
MGGSDGAEFIFLLTDVVVASRSGETTATGDYLAGTNVGTIFLGGQTAENWVPGGAPTPWQYSFTPGRYGIWVQRAGCSLLQVNSVAQPIVPRTPSSALPGRLTFATATGAGYNLIAPGTIQLNRLTSTFTADFLTGNAVMLNVSTARSLQVGMRITGTGIPGPTTANTTFITAIDGATVTMSQAATASNATNTVTWTWGVTSGQATNGSPILTNVPTVFGLYPGQTITGTGIPTSKILGIFGQSPNYSILLDTNATSTPATVTLFTATTATVPNYTEVMLNWPYFSGDTV